MISIDGITWDISCEIKRTVTIEETNISGMMMNKVWFSDVSGSYLSYEVQFVVPYGSETAYDSLFEVITNATGEHAIILPYAQGHVTFTGRIKTTTDRLFNGKGGANYWLSEPVQFISNAPYKTPGNNTGTGVS